MNQLICFSKLNNKKSVSMAADGQKISGFSPHLLYKRNNVSITIKFIYIIKCKLSPVVI